MTRPKDVETNMLDSELHIDPGAEVDVVDQRYAVEQELEIIPDAVLPKPQWMDGKSTYCYGAYYIRYEAEDSWGRLKQCEGVFYAIDKEGPPITLGLPTCQAEGIQIDTGTRTWRFRIETTALEVSEPKQFADALGKETAVYALVVSEVVGTPPVKVGAVEAQANHSKNDNATPPIPKELDGFQDVFSVEEAGKLPSHHGGDHAIETTDDPPYGPLYNLSNTELTALREYLDAAIAKGWIRHSTSPAGAPILFVPKKDGGLRLCVDYRGLNKVTIKNRHPLPLISETLDRLYGAKRFTKLDLKDAYHRLRIKKGDEWKTAFRTRYGHFEYLVMPFGLTNAPATFQAYINKSLAGLLDHFCVVYLDDILIYSDDPEKHLDHVRQVLDRLRQYRLYANPKKCEFFTTQVEFLGFIVSTDGVTMDQSRVDTIQSWPKPVNFHDVQVFLGFVNFYRRFIHRYSQIATPLTNLLQGSKDGVKSGPFVWPDDAERAFRQLLAAFTDVPILRHFDPERKIRVETDASNFAIAGILSQPDDEGHWKPVAFWSRKMIPAERNYETHDQELLAIVAVFKQWRHYLEGSLYPVEVLTDHNNLKSFMNVKQLNGRQARWAMRLSGFDFVVQHRAGKYNPADAPSRRPDYKDENHSLNMLLPTLKQKLAVGATSRDPILAAIQTSYQTEVVASAETAIRSVYAGEAMGSVDVHRTLLGSMTVASQKTCLDTVHPSRRRDSRAGYRPVSDGKTPAQQSCNVAHKGLNPVAGTAGCKQLVPRAVARVMAMHETAYNESTRPMFELIKALQKEDSFVNEQRKGQKQGRRTRRAGAWTFDSQGLLRHKEKLYVPEEESVRQELLKRHHDDELAGHFGIEKTHELLHRKYYWPKMRDAVEEHCKSCDMCQRTKVHRHRPYGELQSLPQPSKPWQEISIDFITGLPPSKRQGRAYDAILVVVDRYTKMVRYLACSKKITAVELADLIFEEVFLRYGVSNGVVSDRGSLFTSAYWSEICYHMKVKRRLSTAFHPQTDGQTERQNQALEHYLRTFCSTRQNNWANLLPLAEFAYQNALHSSIGCSPFFACYGYNPRMDVSVEDNTTEGEVPAAKDRVQKLLKLREDLAKRWQSVADAHARAYDLKHKPMQYAEGDMVMLSTKNLNQHRPSKKLSHKAIGPFRIEKLIGKQAYRLTLPTNYRIHPVFHVSLLERYERGQNSDIPKFLPPDLINDEEEYEVEQILDRRTRKGEFQYKVQWKDWPKEYDQWLPEENLEHAPRLRREYEERAAKRRKTRK